MDYNMVKEICRVNKISLQDLATEIGMSPEGLKRSMESDSLAARYIIPLCKSLYITPNRLFGYGESDIFIQNGINNTQNNKTTVINELTDKLQETESQLLRAEARIDKLLKLLEQK